jgi:arylsulfatase A-like enzyme
MVHAIDWYATFVEAAGGDPSTIAQLDGISMWSALMQQKKSPRFEFVYNFDDKVDRYCHRLFWWFTVVEPLLLHQLVCWCQCNVTSRP